MKTMTKTTKESRKNNLSNLLSGFDGVVPFAVELVSGDFEFGQLFVGDGDSGFVGLLIEGRANGEPGFCRGTGDQVDDGLVAGQRAAAPVFGDEAEQPMFDLVPLAGAGRKMTNLQSQSEFIRERLQRQLPQSVATAVAPAAIGGDHQFRGLGESGRTHFPPPTADAGGGELGVSWSIPTLTQPSLLARSYTP